MNKLHKVSCFLFLMAKCPSFSVVSNFGGSYQGSGWTYGEHKRGQLGEKCDKQAGHFCGVSWGWPVKLLSSGWQGRWYINPFIWVLKVCIIYIFYCNFICSPTLKLYTNRWKDVLFLCKDRILMLNWNLKITRKLDELFLNSWDNKAVFGCCVFSSGSVHNAHVEEDGESSAAAQQNLENSITMTKMKLLKAKMEDMNLNKKVPCDLLDM